ncbi:hypothetical protein LZ30DRAFT_690969 [Colletotrichum cereale]|nr:hypothetical protein LZ30DRAFT_690969 [Colletotrichum cereale]
MNRSRGFVCNYSSSLRDAGVNEKAFSNFINQLNRLAELKPRAQAIDFTGFAHLCSNTHHDLFISMAIGMAIETAKDVQHSTAMNKLVDKANDDLFKPKGLVCLLMTWKPEGPESSSPGRGIRARAVQLVKNERGGRTKRSKAKLSPFQGMGMFEWPKPMSLNRVDKDANILPETATSAACSQHHVRNHSTKSIYSQASQRPVVHHLEDRNGFQTATVEIGAPVHFQEAVPFQLAEKGGLASLKSQGQITLTNLSECSPTEEREISDCNLSSFWDPAAVTSAGDAEKGGIEDRYRRRDLEDSDLSISILSPSFTTGAFKTLETETLYILIANIPDDVETEKDTNWRS